MTSLLYVPVRPGMPGNIFIMDRLHPNQIQARSMVTDKTRLNVRLMGRTDEDLIVYFQYYHWDGVKAEYMEGVPSDVAMWRSEWNCHGLKGITKAPAVTSNQLHPGDAEAGFILRILVYRQNPFGEAMTIVDHLTSNVFQVVSHSSIVSRKEKELKRLSSAYHATQRLKNAALASPPPLPQRRRGRPRRAASDWKRHSDSEERSTDSSPVRAKFTGKTGRTR
jgi:hypothetical protein